MSAVSKEVETGTTALGLVCKDGVILAADRRATAGTLIAHKRTKKVYRLDDNIGLTTAGLVGDLQVLARYVTAEVELYKLKRGVSMPVEACATLTANILAGRRYFPYWVQLVIGGVDRSRGHVLSLDAAGGCPPGQARVHELREPVRLRRPGGPLPGRHGRQGGNRPRNPCRDDGHAA